MDKVYLKTCGWNVVQDESGFFHIMFEGTMMLGVFRTSGAAWKRISQLQETFDKMSEHFSSKGYEYNAD